MKYTTRMIPNGTCVYIFCGIIICHVSVVTGQTSDDAMYLRQDLLQGYHKNIRPLVNQSLAICVTVKLHLFSIIELDEVTEVFKTTGYLSIYWPDDFMYWDPDDYGGIEDFNSFTQEEVWTPDITLKNSFMDYKELGSPSLHVKYLSNGQAYWYPRQIFQSTCSMNIKYYPFDTQTCTLTFVAWSYFGTEVHLLSNEEEFSAIELRDYQPNSAWDIVGKTWFPQTGTGEISFHIKLKRKPLYIILSIILPIGLLAILNIFVFVLPCDSGERSGYAVTVFLSLAVFLIIVSDTLPANSETIAALSVYLILQTVQSTMITLIALITLRINSNHEETNLPSCVIAILKLSRRLQCNRPKRVNKVGGIILKERRTNSVEHESNSTTSVEDRTRPDLGSSVSMQDEEKSSQYTWGHVIQLIDVVCLIFFSFVFVLSTALCFGLPATADQ